MELCLENLLEYHWDIQKEAHWGEHSAEHWENKKV
jgi:hypothetical protein